MFQKFYSANSKFSKKRNELFGNFFGAYKQTLQANTVFTLVVKKIKIY